MSKDVRTRICSRVERNILEISDHKSAQNTEATRRQSNWDSLMLTIVRNTSLSMKRFSFKLKLFSRIFQIFLVICSLFLFGYENSIRHIALFCRARDETLNAVDEL